MKSTPWLAAEPNRIQHPMGPSKYGDDFGAFVFKRHGVKLAVIVSAAVEGAPDECERWDHVSVSCKHRCPTWDEMCYIKDIFFKPEEAVMQIHPPEDDYIDCHPHCLHMWRPLDHNIPLPPSIMVASPEYKKNDTKAT